MLEVDVNDGKTIRVHRGDAGILAYSIPLSDTENYQFQQGDTIEFTVFEKKGYDKAPVLSKEIAVEESCEEVLIKLDSNDTSLGEKTNKTAVYWYEISLNKKQTTLGYDDEEGAAEFRILPAYVEEGGI